MSHYALLAGNVQISFSGGRTSGYMLHQILEANGGLPDRAAVVFANTGREMPQTLDFVQEVSDRWAVPVTWVEYAPGESGKRFKTVSHDSADRVGGPFEALIRRKKYLPNQQTRFCTSELKVRPARDYLRGVGWEYWSAAIGIRYDEPLRYKKNPNPKERWTRWLPLVSAEVGKSHVAAFWRAQPFDLRLPNINGNAALGNCDGCFLKSEAHVAMLARDFPARHAWWEEMEALAQKLTSGTGGQFSKRYTRAELRAFVERQGDWIFETDDALCQQNEGECL